MQNSTQWCNLYSVESKYNLRVCQSAIQRAIYRGVDAVTFLLFCYLISQLYLVSVDASLIKLTVNSALVIAIVIILIKRYYRLPIHQIKRLVLYDNGLIDCDCHSHLSLHVNSRIGWFGCWLILIDNRCKLHVKLIKIFIFKDSLSQQDYARLARAVLSNHRHQSASTSS
jgi:hypothetical protein